MYCLYYVFDYVIYIHISILLIDNYSSSLAAVHVDVSWRCDDQWLLFCFPSTKHRQQQPVAQWSHQSSHSER